MKKIDVKMFLDRMFSYNFSSMPLYFSEKLMSIWIELPQFSLEPVREPCVTQWGGLRKPQLRVPEIGCWLWLKLGRFSLPCYFLVAVSKLLKTECSNWLWLEDKGVSKCVRKSGGLIWNVTKSFTVLFFFESRHFLNEQFWIKSQKCIKWTWLMRTRLC